jgi:hypothetical protein
MITRVERYRACATICAATDYTSKRSVTEHNAAARQLDRIVEEAASVGALSELFCLLDEPESAKWLAHQLLEQSHVPETLEQRCLQIIQELTKGAGANAYGEQIWLREYLSKKGKS